MLKHASWSCVLESCYTCDCSCNLMTVHVHRLMRIQWQQNSSGPGSVPLTHLTLTEPTTMTPTLPPMTFVSSVATTTCHCVTFDAGIVTLNRHYRAGRCAVDRANSYRNESTMGRECKRAKILLL